MLSTLKAIFQGKRTLFDGLKIAEGSFDWVVYPVIHLDLSSARAETPESIASALNDQVMELATQFGVSIERDSSPGVSFERFWRAIALRQIQVVVLVDEYDVLLQGFLRNPVAFEAIRQMMHDFFVQFKIYASNIRFLMLTGVTKFAKLSVFSGLNNLTDLTMSGAYAGLLGYTHEELETYFAEHLDAFAMAEGVRHEEIVAKMLAWYDNYRFSYQNAIRVLNPVSVGLSLSNRDFGKYWNETGTPTLVIEALQKADKWPSDLDRISFLASDLDVCNPLSLPVVPLLYQSGYLTIQDADKELLTLGIPNEEVRSAIVSGHIHALLGANQGSDFSASAARAIRLLRRGEVREAIERFRVAVAAIPYEWLIQSEGTIKVLFLNFFQSMQHVEVQAERQIVNGRMDAVVETEHAIYIVEFKVNRSAQVAFNQIVEKGYHKPYQGKGKPIWGVGLNYTSISEKRGIDEPVISCL